MTSRFALLAHSICLGMLMQQAVFSADNLAPEVIREPLRWLPSGITTLAVSAGRGKYVAFSTPELRVSDTMRQFMSQLPYGSLRGTNVSAALAAFHGEPLRFAVQGAASFQSISKGQFLDSVYDGVHILVFDALSDDKFGDLRDSLKSRGAKEEEILGFDVFVVPGKAEWSGRDWFVARPSRNAVLIASEREMLKESLARIRDKEHKIGKFVNFALERVPKRTAMWAAVKQETVERDLECAWLYAFDSSAPDVARIDYVASADIPLPKTKQDREAVVQDFATIWSLQRHLGVQPSIEMPHRKPTGGRFLRVDFALSRREIAEDFIRVLLGRLGYSASSF